VAIVAVVAGGFGLFGTGVHGLTQVDSRLANGADRSAPATREVRRELGPKRDCPWHERRDQQRLQHL
jgi:hypothetical protein